ncbi:MAG TPA: phage holin family protein [Burkholderiales bacterium]|nr:phage holin family protein [Burkholderiales bacterium]
MIHPLFRLLVSEPQMLADHVEAYAELVTEEVGTVAAQMKRRALLTAAGGVCLLLALLFAAIALMLWGSAPDGAMRAPWVLWVVPGVPLAIGAACLLMARKKDEGAHGVQAIKQQFAEDLAMLRSVRAAS